MSDASGCSWGVFTSGDVAETLRPRGETKIRGRLVAVGVADLADPCGPSRQIDSDHDHAFGQRPSLDITSRSKADGRRSRRREAARAPWSGSASRSIVLFGAILIVAITRDPQEAGVLRDSDSCSTSSARSRRPSSLPSRVRLEFYFGKSSSGNVAGGWRSGPSSGRATSAIHDAASPSPPFGTSRTALRGTRVGARLRRPGRVDRSRATPGP